MISNLVSKKSCLDSKIEDSAFYREKHGNLQFCTLYWGVWSLGQKSFSWSSKSVYVSNKNKTTVCH